MTWWGNWDSGQITKIASTAATALKTAQKRIDQVLDIPEPESGVDGRTSTFAAKVQSQLTSSQIDDTADRQEEDNTSWEDSEFNNFSFQDDFHASSLVPQNSISQSSGDKPKTHPKVTARKTLHGRKTGTSSPKLSPQLRAKEEKEEVDSWPPASDPVPPLPLEVAQGDWNTPEIERPAISSRDEGTCVSPEPPLEAPPDIQGCTISVSPSEATLMSTANTLVSTSLSNSVLSNVGGLPSGTEDEALDIPAGGLVVEENEALMGESFASCPAQPEHLSQSHVHHSNDRALSPVDPRLVQSDIAWCHHSSPIPDHEAYTTPPPQPQEQQTHEDDSLDSSLYVKLDAEPSSSRSPELLLDLTTSYGDYSMVTSSATVVPPQDDSPRSHRTKKPDRVSETEEDDKDRQSVSPPSGDGSGVSSSDLALLHGRGAASTSEAGTTCTSSDIEVISSCCASSVTNEDISHVFLHAPLSHPTGRREVTDSLRQSSFAHKRTASGSNLLHSHDIIRSLRSSDLPSEQNAASTEILMQKLHECHQLLEQREAKLLEQNRDNVLLREELSELKLSIAESRSNTDPANTASPTNIERLTQEFTGRLQNAEKRFQMASRERDQLKKQIQRLEIELASKNDSELVSQALRAKEEQVAELLREGEKLAQEQMKKSVQIKTLRAKEKDLEGQMAKLNEKVSKLTHETENLKKQLATKEDAEKKHVEGIHQLTKSVQWQEKEITRLKGELEDSQSKSKGYQNALEISSRENMSTLRQVQTLQTELDTLRDQMSRAEVGKEQVEQLEVAWNRERAQWQVDLVDLRTAVSRKERDMARLEENLRAEIAYYQERLSAAEERNEELSQSLSSATKPVLRQLETVQATYAQANSNWEKLETSLNSRLVDCQKNLAVSQQQERVWREKVNELEAQVTALESHLSSVKQENVHLQRDLTEEKKRSQLLQLELDAAVQEKEKRRQHLEGKLAATAKEVVLLQGCLDTEKQRVEEERMKFAQLKAEMMAVSTNMNTSVSSPGGGGGGMLRVASTPSAAAAAGQEFFSPMETQSGYFGGSGPQEDTESLMSHGSGGTGPTSQQQQRQHLYESVRGGGLLFTTQGSHAAVMEHLQALLKQKDGEVSQLHRELQQLQRARDSSAGEVARLHALLEQKSTELESLQQRQTALNNVEVRYQALLQLYGEKLEENEELRLDLQDVKEMYKSQIAMLLQEK